MMRAQSSRRRLREDRGAALVEAALVLPMLLMLTFGIWTTARAWNVHNVLDHAAREAARYAATTPDSLTVLDPIARGELLAAGIPWNDVSGCSSIIEGGSPRGECHLRVRYHRPGRPRRRVHPTRAGFRSGPHHG